MSQRIIDLSHPISTATPPWPGCPPVKTEFLDCARFNRLEERHVNSSRFAMNIHCGTHMDAPFHFLDSGPTIDHVPLEHTYGLATLIDLPRKRSHCHITRDDLAPWESQLRRTGKAILRTGWSDRWRQHDFFTDYPDITVGAGEFLAECGVHLVGVETGSVDFEPNETHVVLLSHNVLIVECLTNLHQIDQTEFLFASIPLNLEGLDGSPIRAVAILDG